MTDALRYLLAASFRGRLRTLFRRVRQPRYAVGLVLVAAYFFFIFRTQLGNGREHTARVTDTMSVLLTAYMVLGVAWVWLSAGDRSALALSAAEAAFLLPAPVSRRSLLAYKIMRAALRIIFSAFFATFMFGRSGNLPLTLLRGIGAYLALGTFLVHRIGVSLVRVSQEEHGVSSARRTWLPTAIFVAVAAVLVWSLRDVGATLSGSPKTSWPALVRNALEHGVARTVLTPFRIALAPMLAGSVAEWARAVPLTLVLLALNLVWVFRSNVAFEEAAQRESSKQAERLTAFRERGFSGMKSLNLNTRRTLPLAATGLPTSAIIWKNYLWLHRTGALRTALSIPVIVLLVAAFAAPRNAKIAEFLVITCPILAIYGLITAPRVVRSDLRNSLQNLAVLKTIPMPGWKIVVGEIASSATFAAACEYLLVVAGIVAWLATDKPPSAGQATSLLAVAAPAAAIVSAVAFTIGNGLSLVFPALSRPGAASQGFEMMGQAMLSMVAMLLAFVAVFALPVLIGIGLVVWLRMTSSFTPIAVALASLSLLCAELVLLWMWMGRLLERLEPMDVA